MNKPTCGRATGSQPGRVCATAGIDVLRLQALKRRLELAGWLPGIEMIAAQPDPVSAEPVRIRLLAPPQGGKIVLILEYADGSGMVFTHGIAPAGHGRENRARECRRNAEPGTGEKGDGSS